MRKIFLGAVLCALLLISCATEATTLNALALAQDGSSVHILIDGGNDTLIKWVDFSLDGGTPVREESAPFERRISKEGLSVGPHKVYVKLALSVLGKTTYVTRTVSFDVAAAPEPEPQPTPEPEPAPAPKPEPVENAVNVTTLADSGPGSLRACVEATSGPRTCVFKVEGTITLKSRLSLRDKGVTLAGETAPGAGITLKGDGVHDDPLLNITASDFEVRHLRFRRGPGGGHDNITVASTSRDGHVHHNSISWATDENINTYRDVHDVRFSYNIIAEPLHCSTHEGGGCHGKTGAMGKYETGSQVLDHNLLMSAHDRTVQIAQAYGVAEYVNNVHYNNYDVTNLNGAYTGALPDKGSAVCVNVVGNTYIDGPDSDYGGGDRPDLRVTNGRAGFSVYLADNLIPQLSAIPSTHKRSQPCPSTVTAQPRAEAYEDVLNNAGAWPRDAVDARLVREVRERGGSFKNEVP